MDCPMKLLFVLLLLSGSVYGDGVYIFSGINAFDDQAAQPEINSQSPNAYFGIKYVHEITPRLNLQVGIKHESSVPLKEKGSGMNSFFIEIDIKLW